LTAFNLCDNNSTSNSYDNVYGAVIVAQPHQEFTRFIWQM